MESLPIPREIDFRQVGMFAARLLSIGDAIYVDVQDPDEGNFTLDAREAVDKVHLPENKTNNPAHVFKHPNYYKHELRRLGGNA